MLENLKDDLEVMAVAIGVMSSILLFGRKHILPVLKLLVRPVAYPFIFVQQLKAQMDEILHELKPNSGSTLRDAIIRIEMNQQMLHSEATALMQHSQEAIFKADAGGQFVWTNRAFERLTERSLSEIRGSGWVNILSPEDRPRILTEWNQAIEGQRPFESRFNIRTPTEHTYRVGVSTQDLRDDRDKFKGYLGFIRVLDQ